MYNIFAFAKIIYSGKLNLITMANAKISPEEKAKAIGIVETFNKKVFNNNKEFAYYALFKGNFLYLNRKECEKESTLARLKYSGEFTDWEFAIYKYSLDSYDPEEWMFPGSDHLDGTINGALKAVHEAYPPDWVPSEPELNAFISQLLGGNRKK